MLKEERLFDVGKSHAKSFKRVKKVIMDRRQKPLNKTLYQVLGNNNFADILSKQHY